MAESNDDIDGALWAGYRNTPTCLCTPYPAGNRGCPDHDAAINGRFDHADRTYDDMRVRLGGPPLLHVPTTPPEALELLRKQRS